VLPIRKDTMLYGSNDGGKTVLKAANNKDLRKKVKLACQRLNLKKHYVSAATPLYGPGMYMTLSMMTIMRMHP